MDNDFNDAITAAVRAEHRARGWSVEELGERLPPDAEGVLSVRTLYKLLSTKAPTGRDKPEWKGTYIALVAGALGMSISDLTAVAEMRWAQMRGNGSDARDDEVPPSGGDPHELITWLRDHPDKDGVLQTRLGDLRRQTGLSGRRLAGVEAEMVNTRRRELERALAELAPGGSRPAQAN